MSKKLLLILAIVGIGLLQTSCESDLDINESTAISINNEYTNIRINDSGNGTFSFTSSNSWTISVADTAQWLTLSQMSGEKGEYNINIAADPNYDFNDRKAYLTLKSNNTEVKISVFQEFGNGVAYIPIEDEIFRAYCISNFDTNNDRQISIEEAGKIERIEINANKIRSLKGIEYFSNLTTLYCASNKISELDVSRNKELAILDCKNNKLDNIDLTQNKKLLRLNLSNNMISELDLSKNVLLISIAFENNMLTQIDFNNNNNMQQIYGKQNQLSLLAIDNLKALFFLDASKNQLERVIIGSESLIENLLLNDNKLTSLDLSTSKLLYEANVANNNLALLNITANIRLRRLNCIENPKLTQILKSYNSYLWDLYKDSHTQIIYTNDISVQHTTYFEP